MSNEGKPTLVLNDVLSFIWCNFKVCQKERLLKCLREFYSIDEGHQAYQTLLTTLGRQVNVFRLRQQKGYEPFLALYRLFKQTMEEKLPVIACRNLNNVPILTYKKKVHTKTFRQEHNIIKSQISEVCDILNQLQEQFQILTGKVSNNSLNMEFSTKDRRNSKFMSLKKKGDKFKKKEAPLHTKYNQVDNQNFKIKKKVEVVVGESNSDLQVMDDLVNEDQKVYLIENRQQSASTRLSKYNSIKNHSKRIDKLSVQEEVEETSKESDSEQINAKICPFIKVEQVFDENVGHFTIFKCSHCEFLSNDEVAIILHKCSNSKKTSHKNKDFQTVHKNTAVKVYTCYDCMQTFHNQKSLLLHRKSDCNNGYRCPLCTNRFLVEDWLLHVRSCPGNGTTIREEHYCPLCDVFFADKKILGFHKAHHDISKPFECIICRYRFYTQKSVTDHMKRHAAYERNPKCPFCSFHSTKNLKVTEHIRSHTGDRPYKCHLCDHNAATRDTLKAHIRSHDPRKDFKCDVCGKAFKSMSKLGNHKRMHTNDKPYKCPICGKGFRFGMQMTLHHRTHLDIRKHACPLCPYKARAANVLRGHMNTHTNARPFKCSKCDFASNYKSYLRCHFKTLHPELL